MKFKFIALSLAVAASVVAANAKEAKEGDVFLGVGAGMVSTFNPGLGTPAVYFNLEAGKYITPVWGLRAVVGGPFQNLDAHKNNATINGVPYTESNKFFGELNADVMLNIANIFAEDLAKVDFYVFAGPTLNLSTVGTAFTGEVTATDAIVDYADGLKVRAGATAGLGLAYNITNCFALGIEARAAVTPSIFGDADAYRLAEGTGRLALKGTWTLGGKTGKVAYYAAPAGYLSPEEAEAYAKEMVAKNPKIVEKTVEVEKEVVKEVVKKVAVPTNLGVFFATGKANLTDADKVRIKLFADAIKAAGNDYVYEIGGYADKNTGSVKINQTLSEKRANAVREALIAEGVNPAQLEVKAYGGVDTMFFDNYRLSRAVITRVK